jgi:hypothetical protein
MTRQIAQKGKVKMAEVFLILLVIGYFIYRVTFEAPKGINKLEDEIELVNLHLQEIELKLNQLDRKLDKMLEDYVLNNKYTN